MRPDRSAQGHALAHSLRQIIQPNIASVLTAQDRLTHDVFQPAHVLARIPEHRRIWELARELAASKTADTSPRSHLVALLGSRATDS